MDQSCLPAAFPLTELPIESTARRVPRETLERGPCPFIALHVAPIEKGNRVRPRKGQ